MAPDVRFCYHKMPVYGQRLEVVRTSFRQYLDDWLNGKKAETAPSTMTFYRSGLTKFLQGDQGISERVGSKDSRNALTFAEETTLETQR
jgi:hypothetical protein